MLFFIIHTVCKVGVLHHSTVGYIALAIYWLISAALLAHLYVIDNFCEGRNHACNGTIQKFILLPVLGFFACPLG